MGVRQFVGDTCLDVGDLAAVGRLHSEPMSAESASRAVHEACRQHGVPMPAVTFTGRWHRRTRATYKHSLRRGGRILVHRDGENAATVLHEAAHHLQKVKDGKWDGHGPSFAAWYRRLLQAWTAGFGWPEWQDLWNGGR